MPNLFEPFPFDLQDERGVWDDLIKRFGDLAILRRLGLPDRWCSSIIGRQSIEERLGKLSNPTDRRMLISALAPDTGLALDPEPNEKDMLITLQLDDNGGPILDAAGNPQEDERLRLFSPPGFAGPSRKQLYWRFDARA